MPQVLRSNLNTIGVYMGITNAENYKSGEALVKKMLKIIKDTYISYLILSHVIAYTYHVRIMLK